MYAREFPIRALQALIENKHDSQFININLHQSCTTQQTKKTVNLFGHLGHLA